MESIKKEVASAEAQEKITKYVHANYKQYENKQLYILESNTCFYVSAHKDSSPLILGKCFFS